MNRLVPCALLLLVGLSNRALAQDATFDTQAEGILAPTFTEGGITFSNLDCNLGAPSYSFLADQADGNLTGQPGFTPDMCLGFTGWVSGPGAFFGRVLSFEMTTGQIANEAHLEMWEDGSHPGNTITLEARMGGVAVASDTQTITAVFFTHHTFTIAGVAFDSLRVFGSGPTDNGAFFALVDGVHIGTLSLGTIFCAGDGSATMCPCGNTSPLGAGQGCMSTLGLGAMLRNTGVASLSADTLVLRGSQMPNAPCLYFQGTAQTNGGLGAVFGDGLRCAGGSIARLSSAVNSFGASQYPSGAQASVSVRGQVTMPGVREYQVWYRNAAAFCTPSTFNLTNGLEITWAP